MKRKHTVLLPSVEDSRWEEPSSSIDCDSFEQEN